MKKLFLALCAFFLVAQPSLQADSTICVNITTEKKMLALLASSVVTSAAIFALAVSAGETAVSAAEYINYKVNEMSEELKNLVKSSTLTALTVVTAYGCYKACCAIDNL